MCVCARVCVCEKDKEDVVEGHKDVKNVLKYLEYPEGTHPNTQVKKTHKMVHFVISASLQG